MIELKQSPVKFDEDAHKYMLGDRQLLGITGLIHSILGLGVYPEAEEYVKDFIIPRAGSRGTAIHHAIQTYDQIGLRQETQVVRTRYGCRERDNVLYKDEVWDVSAELDNYIRHQRGFRPIANEHTVSDNTKWASQIDNIWEYIETGGIWLVDTKSNNIGLYPLCGYFRPDFFSSGEEGLKEYLSWQLSIYAVLFEQENPGLKVEGLACNWLRKEEAAFWIIDRKPDALVRELLSSEYIFADNGPVYFHPNPSVFGIRDTALPAKKDENTLRLQPDVVKYMTDVIAAYDEAKRRYDEAKEGLRKAMEAAGVKKCEFDTFSAVISKDSETTTFDSKRFEAEHPELYKEYLTTKPKKGGFTLKSKTR